MKLLRMNCIFVFPYFAHVVIMYIAALLSNSTITPVHRVGVTLANLSIIIIMNDA